MDPAGKRLYYLIIGAWIAGLAWILFAMNSEGLVERGAGVCFFKNISGLPCPSCGATRSLLLLLQGQLVQALLTNPIGIILALLMAVIPVWIAHDLFTGRNGLLRFYHAAEHFISRKSVAIPAGVLMALNWIWNINKGL